MQSASTTIPEGKAESRAIRADIQGLRAIAVLAVVLFHAKLGALSGGFAGVDIFFVISGYLIAGILLREMETGKYSLLGFYDRRVRRLFPALFLMLAFVLLAGALLLTPNAYAELGRTTITTIFFISNFHFFSVSDYFDSESAFRPLLHTWSLAVEEQFYLIFPPFLWVLVKFARKRLRLILAACAVVSLALCLWALTKNVAGAFYLAPFRGYELLIGAIIAGLRFPESLPRSVRDIVSLAGLALIAGSLVLLNESIPFPGLAALAPCLGTAMVLFAGAGSASLGGRLISGPAFRFFGALSYSLYLWHWPVFVLGKSLLLSEPTLLQTVLMIALSVAAATFSWRFIEQPFLKRRGDRKRVLLAGGSAMAVGALAAFGIVRAHGAPQRFHQPALEMFAAKESFSPRRYGCHNFLYNLVPYEQNCVLGADGASPRVAMWADSHGVELSYAIGQRLAPSGAAIMEITGSGCPPALGYSRLNQPLCAAQNDITLASLTNDERIEAVIVAVNFGAYPRSDWPRVFGGLERAMAALDAAGKRLILVNPIPVFPFDVPSAEGVIVEHGGAPEDYGITRRAHLAANAEPIALLAELARRHGSTIVDPLAALCDPDVCRGYERNQGVLYFNRDHLSVAGAALLAAQVPLDEAAAPGASPGQRAH